MKAALRTVSVLLLALWAADASADSETANELERQGVEKTQSQDYEGALELFRQALKEDRSTGLLCNLGNAYLALKRWPEAHVFLKRCLAETAPEGDSDYLKFVSTSFDFVEAQLEAGTFGKLVVKVEPLHAEVRVSTLPQEATAVLSGEFWLPVGGAKLHVSAPEFTERVVEFEIIKGEITQKLIALERIGLPSETASSSVVKVAAPAPRARASRTRVVGAIGSAAFGIGALAAGGYFALEAKEKRDAQREQQLPPGPQYDMLERDGTRLQRVSNGLFAGAAAAGGLAAYLYWTSDGETPEGAPRVSVGPGAVQLSSVWSF